MLFELLWLSHYRDLFWSVNNSFGLSIIFAAVVNISQNMHTSTDIFQFRKHTCTSILHFVSIWIRSMSSIFKNQLSLIMSSSWLVCQMADTGQGLGYIRPTPRWPAERSVLAHSVPECSGAVRCCIRLASAWACTETNFKILTILMTKVI